MNSKQFASVVVITFFVGMIWLAADILFNTKASITISDKLQSLLQPVNPNFNPRILKTIGDETTDPNSIIVSSPKPEATLLPSPTVSANPSSSSTSSPASPSPSVQSSPSAAPTTQAFPANAIFSPDNNSNVPVQ